MRRLQLSSIAWSAATKVAATGAACLDGTRHNADRLLSNRPGPGRAMQLLTATVVACFGLSPAFAQDSMRLAIDLGSVLASEEPCGLSFDQKAIERWIEEHVPADDMSFPSNLSMMTGAGQFQIDEMSKSALVAHCAQIERVARTFGFIP